MAVALSDPYVRNLASVVTTISFVALAILGLLPGLVWWLTHGGISDEPALLANLRMTLFDFSKTGLASELSSAAAYALPALATAICFRKDVQDRLTIPGILLLILLVLAGCAALVSTIAASAPAAEWGDDIRGGVSAVVWLQNTGGEVVRLIGTFVALLIGIRLPGPKNAP